MHSAFFEEFSKIARSAGEGSRGGKVVGHTKSGDPIYESSEKPKSHLLRNLAIGGAALGGAALIGAGIVKGRQFNRFKRAAREYERAGGPWTRGQGRTWEDFRQAGDDFFGSGHRQWGRARDKWKAEHEAYKRASKAGGGGGGYSSGAGRASSSQQASKAYDHIPGLGKVKTKKDAERAYKAAARKNHPDLGGDPEKMKDINSSWDDFKNSPLYEKLAMAYWSSMASALLR